jgi:transcriptional regulator NrdR family protein
MTGEEIEQTLQRVAVAIEQLTQAAVRADERQDSAQQNADERLNALIDAVGGHESLQDRLEESFKEAIQHIAISIQQLTQLATAAYSRLDSLEEEQIHSAARFDALIDAQIQLTRHGDALTGAIVAVHGRFDKVADVLEAVAAAQTYTDEQIKRLLDRTRAAKPERRKASKRSLAKKATKKATEKKGARDK